MAGLRAVSLGSGSKGNCTLIQSAQTAVLLDAGFGVKETQNRLQRVGIHPQQIQAVFVTHEHGDHAQAADRLRRNWSVPVYATAGTAHGARLDEFVAIRDSQPVVIDDLQVHPVLVPHDAREPTQFVFESRGVRLGVCTDLGSISAHVVRAFQELDGLLLEANYDPDMLRNGPYPPKLQARVGGDFGHLSNQQSAELLRSICSPRLKKIVACHLSEKNNHPDQVRAALEPVVPVQAEFEIASQSTGCTWIELMESGHGQAQAAV